MFVVATDDIQSAGGDNICTNNGGATGTLAGGLPYTVTTKALFWITLVVKGTNDVVIVGRNSGIVEPTWCVSHVTLPPWPAAAPMSTPTELANCAPPGRTTAAGTYNGAIPHLFAVVSPSG